MPGIATTDRRPLPSGGPLVRGGRGPVPSVEPGRGLEPGLLPSGGTIQDAPRVDCLLTTDEVAARLACSPALVRRFGARGVLERVKVGRLTRYRPSDVARIIQTGAPSGSRVA